MKSRIILCMFLCIPFIMNAQDCFNSISFDVNNKNSFSVSCGEIEEEGWIVSRNSCNFYTPLTTVNSTSELGGRWVDFRAHFTGGGSLDEKDFIWIFYFVNGKTVNTKTIKGEDGNLSVNISDSIFVNSGVNFRIRIAFVCDEADEFWKLAPGDLNVCVRSEPGDNGNDQKPVADKIIVSKERDIVKLNWYAGNENPDNYFMIERSGNGDKFEFAGYVKSQNIGSELAPFSFIDATTYKPQTWYRIKKIDADGNEIPFGDVVSIY